MDWHIEKWRELEVVPFDKVFQVDGNQESCHATGLEVLLKGHEDVPGNWWNEYKDSRGKLHYGR